MQIKFLTGADSGLFLNVCALASSFMAHEPSARLSICDFGFTRGQAAFLNSLGLLLPIPDHLQRFEHPFYRKGAMVDYLGDSEFDAIVWLDADMLVITPLTDTVNSVLELMHRHQKAAACCCDSNELTVGGFLDHWRPAREDLAYFASKVEANPIVGHAPYLNSAAVIVLIRVARAWRDETLQFPLSFLFEQNAFNQVVWTNGGALVLDPNEWNVNAGMTGTDHSPAPLHTARILHASGGPDTMRFRSISFTLAATKFTAPLKTFARTDLMNSHVAYIGALFEKNMDALAANLLPSHQ